MLHPPREEETELISDAIERSLDVWPLIFDGEMEAAMHRLHTTMTTRTETAETQTSDA